MAQRKFATQREFVESLPAPMFVPWGGAGSAINIARAVGSRLSMPTLQGLAN